MTIERVKDIAIVRIPAGLCLYEERAAGFVASLVRQAEELHRTSPPPLRGVLVLQTAPADDRVRPWLRELEESGLFRDVVARLDNARWLLSLIRNAPVPWVFMSAYDCYGSVWELALSCQRRYWFAPEARLGFPEIEIGAFPPGGVLESLSKRTGRTRERWQTRPVFSAESALEDGLVHFCSETGAWEPQAKVLFQELLSAHPKAGVREAPKKRRRSETFDLQASLESRKVAYEQLESVWKQEQLRHHKYPSAWDYCWQLVKERSKLKEPHELGRLVSHISARHYLSADFQAWLATHLVGQTEPGQGLARRDAPLPPVVIDLNYLAPPTEVLVRLLRRGALIIFVAAEARALATALNLIFSRLERTVSAAQAQALWDRGVTWYQGVCDESRGLVLRWSVDDRFLVSRGGKDTPFLRLEGNAANAHPGLLEWEGGELEPLVQAMVPLVADGIVRTGPRPAGGMPVSVYVRSLFFEEMLRIAKHCEADASAVTEGLRESGWHFGGDDEAWDRFLKTRYDAYSFETDLTGLGARALDRAGWEIGTWKHARALAKRQSADPEARRWNATAVSQHMGVFLGLVADLLTRRDPPMPRPTAEHLSAVALGFPAAYGTPLGFLRRRGRRRVEAYARSQWPRYQLPAPWSDDAPRP